MTSNLGSPVLLEGLDSEGNITEEAKNEVTAILRRTFRPEFLNRLDEIVFYKPLSKENIRGIIDLLTASLAKRLAEKDLCFFFFDGGRRRNPGAWLFCAAFRPLRACAREKAAPANRGSRGEKRLPALLFLCRFPVPADWRKTGRLFSRMRDFFRQPF